MNKNLPKIISVAHELELFGHDLLYGRSFYEIDCEYNGIGPAFFSPELRNKVTTTLHIFEPAALIHDIRFSHSDGSRQAFNQANAEFLVNCRKCAKTAYPWWCWKRYRAFALADAMFDFVSGAPGWKAWCDACKAQTK